MANAVRLFSALKPNPLSALVPLKNPVVSMATGFFCFLKNSKITHFFAPGGNVQSKFLKPCGLRVIVSEYLSESI